MKACTQAIPPSATCPPTFGQLKLVLATLLDSAGIVGAARVDISASDLLNAVLLLC